MCLNKGTGGTVTTSMAGADGLAVDLADNVAGGLNHFGLSLVQHCSCLFDGICAAALANRSDFFGIRSYENSKRASYAPIRISP